MQRLAQIVLTGSCVALLGCFRPAVTQSFPAMQRGGGPTLDAATLVSIVVEGDPVATELFAFADALIRSPWWASFGDGYALTAPARSVHVTGPALPSDNVSDADMVAYIQRLIASGAAPAPDGKTIFVLYLPFGVTPSNDGCERLVGYHEAFDSAGDAFAVLLRCEVTSPTLIDDLTVAASHEIAESASDPLPRICLDPRPRASAAMDGQSMAAAGPPRPGRDRRSLHRKSNPAGPVPLPAHLVPRRATDEVR